MAKKAKKRKGAAAAPKAAEGQVLGTLQIPVQVNVYTGDVVTFDELVIEWSCLGLSEEPDKIVEVSGNATMLDPDRLPTTSEEGLHVFFKPPRPGGIYGFNFLFTYNDSVQARTADPKKVEELKKALEQEAA